MPLSSTFLSRLFGRPELIADSGPQSAPPNALESGERIYAIGDIHGRADLLDQIWEQIEADLKASPPASASIVYLGDYIDRGPDSAGVLSRLVAPPDNLPKGIALKGNHEHVMSEFLAGEDLGDLWRGFGGFETMRSYGVDPTRFPGRRWVESVRDALLHRIPQKHRTFLDTLAISLDRPPYLFVHAGIRPGVPFTKQKESALLWIREEFLRSEADFGRIVVHGHTPVRHADVRHNRINVDTGAYATGELTCAVLEIDTVRLISTAERTIDGVSRVAGDVQDVFSLLRRQQDSGPTGK